MRILLSILPIVALTATALAVPFTSSTLSLTVNSNAQTMDVDVTGSLADSQTWLVISRFQGSTFVDLGRTSFTVDLNRPLTPVAIGTTDANGDLSTTLVLPDLNMSFFGQAVSIDLEANTPSVDNCVSNVVPFTI